MTSQRPFMPEGSLSSRIMIVGDAPDSYGLFLGPPGQELTRMLNDAKISRSECFITSVCRQPPSSHVNEFFSSKAERSPAHVLCRDKWCLPVVSEGLKSLEREVSLVKPYIIIAMGNVAMWALTGRWSITKWRGSMLYADNGSKVIPTIHPLDVLRQWSWRPTVINDLRRAARFRNGSDYPVPNRHFILRPSYEIVINTLDKLIQCATNSGDNGLVLSFDLETRAGHIACAGISWSTLDGICIPFMCVGAKDGYWDARCEGDIIYRLWQLLRHPRVNVVGQNILYDAQYTYRHWHFVPRVTWDTMIGQHAIFSDRSKSLAFLASEYCDYYVYWKDEGKNWDPKVGEEQLWHYNLEDCVYTYEVFEKEKVLSEKLGLRSVMEAQQRLFWPVLNAMQKGVKIDTAKRSVLTSEVHEEIHKREEFLVKVLGHPFNPRSPKQKQALFYKDLGQSVIMTRAAKDKPARPTVNDEALQTIARREPLLKPIVNAIADIGTLGIFESILTKELDVDERMRCAYNIGGSESGKSAPKTYRLSSSENAFGSGTNLQNIPSEKSKSLGKASARGAIQGFGDPYAYPNIREIFIPDIGYTFFDGDLDRADLQVVIAEADDTELRKALDMGVDLHLMNAYVLQNKKIPDLTELCESHPKYLDWRRPMKMLREFAKVFIHGTNYGGKPRTMSANTGWTIREVERAQTLWFSAHPGIERWHRRVKDQIQRCRFIENRFGYRWYIDDRVDSVIPEAIAWIPQSTVSVVINRIWENIYVTLPQVQVLLQVHDSLCGQFPSSMPAMWESIRRCGNVEIPYDRPLIIPFNVKTSTESWGKVK